MTDTIKIFSGTSGINNKVDPVRLKFNPETGISELASAVNVDIDSTGRISTRKGFIQKASGHFHSLYSLGEIALVVKDGYLGILGNDFSFTSLISIHETARVSYKELMGRVYFCNGFTKGYYEKGVIYSWAASEYIGPATTKTFSDPPIGYLLELFNGRMYIAVEYGNSFALYYSESRAYSWFDYSSGWIPFQEKITMVKKVKGGFWIGTEKRIVFLSGTGPEDFSYEDIAFYGVLEGTGKEIQGQDILGGQFQGKVILFGSKKGICLGGPNGEFLNLTKEKLILPEGNRGIDFFDGDKYYCLIEE